MSDAIRQIRARARRKAAGLVRLEFWVPADRRDAVRLAVQAILQGEAPAAPSSTLTPAPGPTTGAAAPLVTSAEEASVPVGQRRQRLMTDIDGLLD